MGHSRWVRSCIGALAAGVASGSGLLVGSDVGVAEHGRSFFSIVPSGKKNGRSLFSILPSGKMGSFPLFAGGAEQGRSEGV